MPGLLRCLEIRECEGWVRCAITAAYPPKRDVR